MKMMMTMVLTDVTTIYIVMLVVMKALVVVDVALIPNLHQNR
jgi:hypothetical protein